MSSTKEILEAALAAYRGMTPEEQAALAREVADNILEDEVVQMNTGTGFVPEDSKTGPREAPVSSGEPYKDLPLLPQWMWCPGMHVRTCGKDKYVTGTRVLFPRGGGKVVVAEVEGYSTRIRDVDQNLLDGIGPSLYDSATQGAVLGLLERVLGCIVNLTGADYTTSTAEDSPKVQSFSVTATKALVFLGPFPTREEALAEACREVLK